MNTKVIIDIGCNTDHPGRVEDFLAELRINVTDIARKCGITELTAQTTVVNIQTERDWIDQTSL